MPKSKEPMLDTFSFLLGLQNLLELLPTEDQRQETTAIFNKLIHFFTDLRDKFSALPTREDAADIQQSLVRLEKLLSQTAKADDINQNSSNAPTRKATKKPSEADVSALAEAIKRLPAEEIRARLSDKKHLAATIKQVAQVLGMTPGSKRAKAILIDEIVNYIENARMGDRMAGRTESEWLLANPNAAETTQNTTSS